MQAPPSDSAAKPSLPTVILMVLFTYGVTAATAYFLSAPRDVLDWGDAVGYSQISDAIFRGDIHALKDMHLFWGLPYFAAALRWLSPLSMNAAQAVAAVSLIASITAIVLAARLWGSQVAALFGLVSIEWIQRSVVGGPEPLCMALLFGAFCLWRRNHWNGGALLAAIAVTVRPLAIFALVAAGLVALKQRHYRRFFAMTLISVAVGALYVLPLLYEFGDPLLNYHNYQKNDWDSSLPIGIPFVAIARGLYQHFRLSLQFLYCSLWLVFLLVALVCAVANRTMHQMTKERPAEWIYALLLILFLLSYNSSQWNWQILPRVMIPALPFLLIAVGPPWPRRQGLVWVVLAAIALLAGASIANIDHSIQVVKRLMIPG